MHVAKEPRERASVSYVAAVAAALILTPPLVVASPGQALRVPGQPRDALVLRGPGAWLGVTLRNLTPTEADQWQLDSGGAVIEGVAEDGPAWRAGLRSGDVVTRFDDHAVSSARDLIHLIRDTPPEWTVKANIAREGVSWEIDLTVEVEPGPARAGAA